MYTYIRFNHVLGDSEEIRDLLRIVPRPGGLNRTSGVTDWGAKTVDSALQMVLHQRLLEEHGGDGWTFETLPLLLRDWLIGSGKQRGTSKAS